MRILGALMLVGAGAVAQSVIPTEEQVKLAEACLNADDARAEQILAKLSAVPQLSKAEAKAWTARVEKWLAKGGPKLEKGTSYFYDEKTKRGKYILAGAGNTKGLVFGLHGGGQGSADCTGAASAFGGAITGQGMLGIFPEAIEATEAAWGDDVTIRFVLDLLAAARRTFRFDPDRVYVVGHSMGGYGAWTWGGRFSDRLAGVASFAGSPTPVQDSEGHLTAIQPGILTNLLNVRLWAYHSLDDPRVAIAGPRLAIQLLSELKRTHPTGFDYTYDEVDKRGHDFPAKGPKPALEWITARRRDARPRKILWEPFYERSDQSYWLAWAKPVRGAVVQAEWDGKAGFSVSGDGRADDLAILLDDAMTDVDGPITIDLGAQRVFSGIPKRSLTVLLASARARRDPRLLFTARVPLKSG